MKHLILTFAALALCAQDLPNGWKLSPSGKSVATEDIAVTAGFNSHSLVVLDTKMEQVVQRINPKSAYNGLAWSSDGKSLYVSGGNTNSSKNPTRGKLS